jgi:hypothetical protein
MMMQPSLGNLALGTRMLLQPSLGKRNVQLGLFGVYQVQPAVAATGSRQTFHHRQALNAA